MSNNRSATLQNMNITEEDIELFFSANPNLPRHGYAYDFVACDDGVNDIPDSDLCDDRVIPSTTSATSSDSGIFSDIQDPGLPSSTGTSTTESPDHVPDIEHDLNNIILSDLDFDVNLDNVSICSEMFSADFLNDFE